MPDINITVTIPEAKVPVVRDSLARWGPLLPGETERDRAKRFLREMIIQLVESYQRDTAAIAIVRDEGVIT